MAWLRSIADADLCLSAVTLGEIQSGIEPTRAMIAATAIVHSLTVDTRNVADFSGFGVKLFNPFEAAKPGRT